jgi:RHS repeat-associated protein
MWNAESADNLDGRRFIWDGWSEIQERIFEEYDDPEGGDPIMPTEDDAHSKAERVYVLGPSIDEPLMVAIDGDLDGDVGGDASPSSLTGSLNKPEYELVEGEVSQVGDRIDFAYYFLNNRMGCGARLGVGAPSRCEASASALMALLARDLDLALGTGQEDFEHARILEYYRYSAYGTATVMPAHDDGTTDGLVGGSGIYDGSGTDDGSGSHHAWDGVEDTPLTLDDNNALMLARRNGTTHSGSNIPTSRDYSVPGARGESYGRVSQFGNFTTFTGRRLDPTTGLMYYRYRYYEPVAGRFVGRDPAGYQDSLNAPAFVWNSPVNFGDPLGLSGTAFMFSDGYVYFRVTSIYVVGRSNDGCSKEKICADFELTSTSTFFDNLFSSGNYNGVSIDSVEVKEDDD